MAMFGRLSRSDSGKPSCVAPEHCLSRLPPFNPKGKLQMKNETPSKTEDILFRALLRVRELPPKCRVDVLDRGMEQWFETALDKYPRYRQYLEESEAFDEMLREAEAGFAKDSS